MSLQTIVPSIDELQQIFEKIKLEEAETILNIISDILITNNEIIHTICSEKYAIIELNGAYYHYINDNQRSHTPFDESVNIVIDNLKNQGYDSKLIINDDRYSLHIKKQKSS